MKLSVKFLLTLFLASSLQIACSSEISKEDRQNASLEAIIGDYSLAAADSATYQDEAGVATCSKMEINLSRGTSTLNIDQVTYTCADVAQKEFRPITLTLAGTTLKQGIKEVGSITEGGFSFSINTDYKISLVLDTATSKYVFTLNNVLNNKAYKLSGDLTKM